MNYSPRNILKKIILLVLALLSYWPATWAQACNFPAIIYLYFLFLLLFCVYALAEDFKQLAQTIQDFIETFRT